MNVVHLHVHSHYSLLDGLPKIPELCAAAREQGATALALTDHGALYGAVEFYKTAKRLGIKPIIGMEAYVAPGALHSKSGRSDSDYHHLVLLARNFKGYQNLLQLVSVAHLEGFYYKPRVDKALLQKHAEGLIGLSGCLRGELPRAVGNGQSFPEIQKIAAEYKNIFGEGNFYLELQRNIEGEDR